MECYYRAMCVLASLEYPDLPHDSQWLDQLIGSRYQHVVSAQAYGAQRKSRELKDWWAAQGIELLLKRHPALMVAYLDAAGKGKPSYSVLLKGFDALNEDIGSQVGCGFACRWQPGLRVSVRCALPFAGAELSTVVDDLHDALQVRIEEVYRVRLPSNPYSSRGIIIGEGKASHMPGVAALLCSDCAT
jgi:hypothetical protein